MACNLVTSDGGRGGEESDLQCASRRAWARISLARARSPFRCPSCDLFKNNSNADNNSNNASRTMHGESRDGNKLFLFSIIRARAISDRTASDHLHKHYRSIIILYFCKRNETKNYQPTPRSRQTNINCDGRVSEHVSVKRHVFVNNFAVQTSTFGRDFSCFRPTGDVRFQAEFRSRSNVRVSVV